MSKAWDLIHEHEEKRRVTNPFKDMISVEPVGHHPYYLEEPDVSTTDIDNEEHVLVPMKVFRELERSERELLALQSAGVDNWSGSEYVNWEYVDSGEGGPNRV